jgi:divalent metal cation (Fe/Co/Zn/Cd) transporter
LPEAPATAPSAAETGEGRAHLIRRARILAWIGNAWHLAEFAVAIAAGIMASSIALIAFGFDSIIEGLSGFVIVWRFGPRRTDDEGAERRAQRLVGGSFFFLAAYVVTEAVRSLVTGSEPEASWLGIALAAVTALSMPVLAMAKRRVGRRLGSMATTSEGDQNMLCAYLSVGLLLGLLANALLGWWWADPAAALAIAAIAVKEGVGSWRGDGCCEAC